ncbi:tryptophan synthase beta subunit-like PLP-dependent enzyme [Aspergillus falconensis]
MSPRLNLPDPFAAIPRVNLLYPFPSPIHPLQSLSGLVSASASVSASAAASAPQSKEVRIGRIRTSLYAKREDHSSPLACAGNKYRKLEYILPDILSLSPRYGAGVAADVPTSMNGKENVTTLVTEGAIQSNHTVQVASVASRIGLESVVLLHKGTGGGLSSVKDKEAFLRTGNVQVVKLLGAEVRMFEKPVASKTQDDIVEEVLNELREKGKVPYWIPSGASLHPLGGLGYARCAFEIAAQERETLGNPGGGDDDGVEQPRFDYIFAACGSGSTVGGLIAGFKLLEKMENSQAHERRRRQRPRRIIGILTSPTMRKGYHEERILRFARGAGEIIGLNPQTDITMDDVVLDDRFAGKRYGVLDAKTKGMLSLMAEKEEVMLDPVYTAKVARGMVHWAAEGEIERDVLANLATHKGQEEKQVNILFIHTGGQSALGAYADV